MGLNAPALAGEHKRKPIRVTCGPRLLVGVRQVGDQAEHLRHQLAFHGAEVLDDADGHGVTVRPFPVMPEIRLTAVRRRLNELAQAGHHRELALRTRP